MSGRPGGHGGVGYGFAGSPDLDAYTRERSPADWVRARPKLRFLAVAGRLTAMRHDHVHPGRSIYARDPHPPTLVEVADMVTSTDDVRVAQTMAFVERFGYDGPSVVDSRGLIPDPAVSLDIRARQYATWLAAQDPEVMARRAASGLG